MPSQPSARVGRFAGRGGGGSTISSADGRLSESQTIPYGLLCFLPDSLRQSLVLPKIGR